MRRTGRGEGGRTYLKGVGEGVVGVKNLGAHDGWRGAD